MLSGLDQRLLLLQTAVLHVEAMLTRNAEREIVSQSTKMGPEDQLQELRLQRQEALQLRPLHRGQDPRRPGCQLAGHILDVFSEPRSSN
jgi:predicted component of type VI protein secretion system